MDQPPPFRRLGRYRQLLRLLARHGFGFLLDELGLSHPRAMARLRIRRSSPVPPMTHAARLRLVFEELGTTYVKLGQILSTRSDLLPPDFIAELAKLQDEVPPEPADRVISLLESELGRPVTEVFASFDPSPLASASIGQVHAARLPTGEEVIVKVQRAGIQELVEEDISVLQDLARLASGRTVWGQVYDLPSMIEEFADTLRAELDYGREGRNADRIRRNFEGDRSLHVPKIYWAQSSKRVLTMERVQGIKINDVAGLEAAGMDRRRIALSGVRMVLKMMLEDGFYHADPHPGNLLLVDPDTIGLLDYGMVGQLDPETREDLLYLFMAIADQDLDRAIDGLVALGIVGTTLQVESMKHDLGRLLSLYYGLPTREIEMGRVLLDSVSAARRNKLQVPARLNLLVKTLVMHEGLALQLDPDFNLAEVLGPYARNLVWRSYLPQRLAKRVLPSVMDLSRLAVGLPRRMDRLLAQAERGNVSVSMRVADAERYLGDLNRMVNRLVLAMLTSGFIIGLAVMMQFFQPMGLDQAAGVLLMLGFVFASVLGLWLMLSIWRGGPR